MWRRLSTLVGMLKGTLRKVGGSMGCATEAAVCLGEKFFNASRYLKSLGCGAYGLGQ